MPKDIEAAKFSLVIASPDQVIFDGDAVKLLAPGLFQDLAILPDHTPLYAQLQPGRLNLEIPDGSRLHFDILGGILRVRANRVSIVTGFESGFTS
jgi:F-type H+-transporting ATPase subunit epsilon